MMDLLNPDPRLLGCFGISGGVSEESPMDSPGVSGREVLRVEVQRGGIGSHDGFTVGRGLISKASRQVIVFANHEKAFQIRQRALGGCGGVLGWRW